MNDLFSTTIAIDTIQHSVGEAAGGKVKINKKQFNFPVCRK